MEPGTSERWFSSQAPRTANRLATDELANLRSASYLLERLYRRGSTLGVRAARMPGKRAALFSVE